METGKTGTSYWTPGACGGAWRVVWVPDQRRQEELRACPTPYGTKRILPGIADDGKNLRRGRHRRGQGQAHRDGVLPCPTGRVEWLVKEGLTLDSQA